MTLAVSATDAEMKNKGHENKTKRQSKFEMHYLLIAVNTSLRIWYRPLGAIFKSFKRQSMYYVSMVSKQASHTCGALSVL